MPVKTKKRVKRAEERAKKEEKASVKALLDKKNENQPLKLHSGAFDPDLYILKPEIDELGRQINARRKSDGIPVCGRRHERGVCPAQKIDITGRCRRHGGFKKLPHTDIKALAKQEDDLDPNLLRYSHLPAGLYASVKMHHGDENYLSLRPEIAYIQAVIGETASEQGAMAEASMRLIMPLVEEIEELVDEDGPGVLEEMKIVSRALAIAVRKYQSRRVNIEVIKDHQRHLLKLAEVETKRISAGMKQLSAEQAVGFAESVALIVTNHVSSLPGGGEVMEKIADDIDALMQVPGQMSKNVTSSLRGSKKDVNEARKDKGGYKTVEGKYAVIDGLWPDEEEDEDNDDDED